MALEGREGPPATQLVVSLPRVQERGEEKLLLRREGELSLTLTVHGQLIEFLTVEEPGLLQVQGAGGPLRQGLPRRVSWRAFALRGTILTRTTQ